MAAALRNAPAVPFHHLRAAAVCIGRLHVSAIHPTRLSVFTHFSFQGSRTRPERQIHLLAASIDAAAKLSNGMASENLMRDIQQRQPSPMPTMPMFGAAVEYL